MTDDNQELLKTFNFTQKTIADFVKKAVMRMSAADAKEKQVYGNDTQTRGLEISVSKSGSTSYVYRRKVNGVTRRKILGLCHELSIEQARGKASDFNAAFGRGENPFEEAAAKKQELTLQEAFDIYLERHAKKLRKTWPVMKDDFERKLTAALRGTKLSKITQTEAEKLHSDFGLERGEYSANRIVQLLRAVYNKMKSWKLYAGDNPFVGISLFHERPRERFLSEEEAGKLLKALEVESYTDLRDFLTLSLFTAARKTNVLSMRYPDIDWDRGLWTIPDTKNGSKQMIALGGKQIALLKARQDSLGGDFVFPGEGKSGHLVDVKRSWTTLRNKLGLHDVTIHDLRRSLAAGMANANVNVALVKGALGHKDLKTTMTHYAHTQKQAELEARELVHERWRKAAEPKPEPETDNVLPLRQAQ